MTPEDEAICTRRAMEQWEASCKRPDLKERDRVRGALAAFARQALALELMQSAILFDVGDMDGDKAE